jgi:long-chain acyl-CoA synthetase
VPDPQFGEGIKAVCVLKPGAGLSADELVAFVAAKIARYKKPRYVEFASALPKNAAGQVDRAQVKALYGATGPSQ